MKFNLTLYLAALFSVLVPACAPKNTISSASVDPASIYQDYAISVMKKSTTVVGIFRDGGPEGRVIELRAPSRLEYNGDPVKKDRRVYSESAAYTSYLQEFFSDSTLVFTDPTGKNYTNKLTIDPVELKSGPVSIDRSHDIVIELTRPVKVNETLVTTVALTARNDSSGRLGYITLENNFAEGRSSIIIRATDLARLASGSGVISIKVRAEKPLDENTGGGGRMAYDYTSDQVRADATN